MGWINNGGSTSVAVTGLSGNNTFQVRAVGSSATGQSASTGQFTIPSITGPSITKTATTADFSWTSTNQSTYSLSITGAPSTPYTGTTAISRSITSLSGSTSYNYTLTISSSTSDTVSVSGTFVTNLPTPSITFSAISNTSFTASWGTLGATKYNVDSFRTLNGNQVPGFPKIDTTLTSVVVSGLTANIQYTVTVIAKNDSGGVSSQAIANVTTTNTTTAATTAATVATTAATVATTAATNATTAQALRFCPSLGYNVPSSGWPGNCPGAGGTTAATAATTAATNATTAATTATTLEGVSGKTCTSRNISMAVCSGGGCDSSGCATGAACSNAVNLRGTGC